MTEVLHSPIGASSCERWWNCPGSFWLSQQAPSPPTTIYAATGTVAHSIGEFYLRSGGRVDDHWLGQTVEQEGFSILVDDEMLDAVELYVDFVYKEMDKYGVPYSLLQVEKGFSLSHIDPEAYGTCDASIEVPYNRLIVVDYKHGAGVPVDAQGNKQTLYYGLGAYWELPAEEREEIDYVETIIVQPRADHPDGPIRRAVYTVQELLSWSVELYAAVRRVRSGLNYFETGAHCKFCPAKTICPEAKNVVSQQAAIDFADHPMAIPKPVNMTAEEVARALKHVGFIEEWCDSLRAHAHSLAERGVEIPGYKLVAKRSNRRWEDKTEVANALELAYGDAIYDKKLKSPRQMETLVGKQNAGLLEKFIIRPEAGNTLVPITDSREKRTARAIAAFEDLDLDI